jgi:hypothetical protein
MSAALVCVCLGIQPSAAEEEAASLAGRWKFVVLSYGPDEFYVVTLGTPAQGKIDATLDASQEQFGQMTLAAAEYADDVLRLDVQIQALGGVMSFRGKAVHDGDDKGRVLGTVTIGSNIHPARLERTEDTNLAPLGRGEFVRQVLILLQEEGEPAEKVAKLAEMIDKAKAPYADQAYAALVSLAPAAGLPLDEVQQRVDEWTEMAARYGDDYLFEVRLRAAQALGNAPQLSALALSQAQAAVKQLPDGASADKQSRAWQLVLATAGAAGKPELVSQAEEVLAKLEAQLDAEYLAKVPPFKPEKFSGRKDSKNNRVVVMELFTGTQCPPCVAADVAFDALLKSYEPDTLVALQYHLHIPGPDPLTNPDTEARSEYYQVGGTPSTYFNGLEAAGGGGGMGAAQGKYEQYRSVIDPALEDVAQADINLKVARTGDKLTISAKARRKAAGKNTDQDDTSNLRLRLVLTEETVRYVGGNGIRFHHHVVRAFPGGVDGQPFSDNRASAELTIDLNDVRKSLEEYLDQAAQQNPFPKALPKIELAKLAVVALVQDDADHAILHAVSVPVPEE